MKIFLHSRKFWSGFSNWQNTRTTMTMNVVAHQIIDGKSNSLLWLQLLNVCIVYSDHMLGMVIFCCCWKLVNIIRVYKHCSKWPSDHIHGNRHRHCIDALQSTFNSNREWNKWIKQQQQQQQPMANKFVCINFVTIYEWNLKTKTKIRLSR